MSGSYAAAAERAIRNEVAERGIGPSRGRRWPWIIALFASVFLIGMAIVALCGPALAGECRPGPGRGVDGHWWRYRVVDGRRCWYLGKGREQPRRARAEAAGTSARTGPLKRGPRPPADPGPAGAPLAVTAADRVTVVFGPDGDAAIKVAAAENPRTLSDLARMSNLPPRPPEGVAENGVVIPEVPVIPRAVCPTVPFAVPEVRIVRETSWGAVAATFVGTAAGSSLIWIGALWWERRRRQADDVIREEIDLIHDHRMIVQGGWRAPPGPRPRPPA